eukprot:TRINITY_DN875_c0_g2_i1.p1 TRINITY_DN875_c0_g2~~TRINITY_DN875_c0_g2_i1.p1  ORF type:complete len:277 (-),score=93.04 TRINITY_DN875_c0_g2_i1:367-1197(-)
MVEMGSLLEEVARSVVALQDAEIEADMLRQEKEELAAENSALRTKADKVPELEDEVAKLKAAIREAQAGHEAELESLRTKLAESEDRNHQQAGQIERLAIREKELASQLASAKQQNKESQCRISELEGLLDQATRRSDALAGDVVDLKSRNAAHEATIVSRESTISELNREIARLKDREKALLAELQQLDIYKLDLIARELKKIERGIGRCRSEAHDLVNHSQTLSSPADKESTHGCASSLLRQLEENREAIKQTIQQCLSELQKYHIGSGIKPED